MLTADGQQPLCASGTHLQSNLNRSLLLGSENVYGLIVYFSQVLAGILGVLVGALIVHIVLEIGVNLGVVRIGEASLSLDGRNKSEDFKRNDVVIRWCGGRQCDDLRHSTNRLPHNISDSNLRRDSPCSCGSQSRGDGRTA